MEWGSVVAWVSASVALSSLGFAIWQYRKNRKVKLITYQVVSDEPLVPNIGDPELGNLTVTRDGKALTYPRSVVVTFTNAGDVEALEAQLATPPTLNLSGQGSIVDASLIFEAKGSAARQAVTPASQTTTSIEAPKQLMNSGDRWRFRLLVDGRECAIEPLVHVEGFNFKEGARPSPSKSPTPILLALAALITSILALGVGVLAARRVTNEYGNEYQKERTCREILMRQEEPKLTLEESRRACVLVLEDQVDS